MSFISKSRIWFGVNITSDKSDPIPFDQRWWNTHTPFTQQLPFVDQHVHERYFKEVDRHEFFSSDFLQEYAEQRNTTPHLLYINYTLYIKKMKKGDTVSNFIDFLNFTDPNRGDNNKHLKKLRTEVVHDVCLGGLDIEKSVKKVHDRKTFTASYTHEDFLRVKREAEEIYELIWQAKEKQAAQQKETDKLYKISNFESIQKSYIVPEER